MGFFQRLNWIIDTWDKLEAEEAEQEEDCCEEEFNEDESEDLVAAYMEKEQEIRELKKQVKELEKQQQQYGGFRNLGEVMYACKATKEIWGKKD